MLDQWGSVRLTCASIACALAACLGLAACGGASHGSSSSDASRTQASQPAKPAQSAAADRTPAASPPSPGPPQTVLARVGGQPITLGAVEHLIAIKSAPAPAPDPPLYSSCIASAKAAGKASPEPSEAELKRSCEARYEELLQNALNTAIHAKWVGGEAAAQKLDVSAAEVEHELDLTKKSFKTEAAFASYRKSTGQTLADMRSELKIGKLTDKLFKLIEGKAHPASSADVSRYYDSHLQQFTIPQGRDVRILRTATAASAAKAKSELESGKSFAAVVQELSAIAQPITAKNGEVADLKPNLFEEPVLNDAIFNAKLNRLYGPVRVIAKHKTIAPESGSGYYVFEAKKLVPGGRTPLSQVAAALGQELTKAAKLKTTASFIKAFRAKWRSRTDCIAGYVVSNCKQFKAAKGEGAEDPYAL